ncbi:MAG: DUF4350 domain-containing protein [Saprospirales bacterium]|nr:DUF4350 domain-containing protein [Saprospirales bacterium]
MEKNRIWLWGGFLVLVLAVLLFLFWPGDKRTNWTESYRHDSNQPYGTQLIHALLKDQAGEDRFFIVEDSLIGNLTKWEGSPANYVFIGPGILLDSLEEDYLLAFAEQGNTLFLALNGLPVGLLSRLLSTDLDSLELDRYSYRMDSTVSATLTYDQWQDTRLQLTCYDQTGALEYNWAYWNLALLAGLEEDSITAETLGILDAESINFIRIPYGRGVILFHSTPLAFTNFYVKESDGLDYADKVMAYLNDGPIYWDHYSDYESAFRRTWGRRPPRTTRSISGEGPLQYILSQPPLAWAWYVGLSSALMYLLFRAKRRQRIIPVLEPNTNTSMEFIATIGQLYFQQNSHRKLAIQKWKLFLGFVRDRYHLPTRELDEPFIKKLAERSGIEKETLAPLFRLAQNIERSEVFLSENTLIDLHRALDIFYRTCK